MGSDVITTIPGYRRADLPSSADGMRMRSLCPFVRQSGNQHRPPWHLASRRLLDYLVVFILKGRGRFTVGATSFDVGPGDLAWIPPDTPHAMRGHPPGTHLIYVHFDLVYDPARSDWDACIPPGTRDVEPFRRFMHPPINDPVIASWCGRLPVVNPTAVETRLRDICFEHGRSPSGSALLLSGMMLGLLAEIIHATEPVGALSPAHVRGLRAAEATIQERADRNLHIDSLAKEAHLSGSHFRRLFRQLYGESPRSMHRRARIRRACELLVYSDLNVSEIADSLGFSTVHNLSRAFRQVMGVAPSQYRNG